MRARMCVCFMCAIRFYGISTVVGYLMSNSILNNSI